MQMFQEMNRKLDLGWKLTDSSCQSCKSVVMLNPHNNTLVCISGKHQNSERPFDQPISESSESEFVELTNEVVKRSKSDDISKKLGEKLIQGWAMLEDVCQDCNVPIMRSKKGEMVCFGCNRGFRREGEGEKVAAPREVKAKVEEKEVGQGFVSAKINAAPQQIPETKPTQTHQLPFQPPSQPQPLHQSILSTPFSDPATEKLISTLYSCLQKRFLSQFESNAPSHTINQTFSLFQRLIDIKSKLAK